jgi:cytochrome c556
MIEDGNDRVEKGRIQYDQQKDQQNLKEKEKQCQASCSRCHYNYVDLN